MTTESNVVKSQRKRNAVDKHTIELYFVVDYSDVNL